MTVQNANHDKPARSPGIIYCSLVHPRSEGENPEGGESSASRTRGAAAPPAPLSLPLSPHPAVLQATASLSLRFLSCRRTPGTGTPFSAERGCWRQEAETRTQETTPRGRPGPPSGPHRRPRPRDPERLGRELLSAAHTPRQGQNRGLPDGS